MERLGTKQLESALEGFVRVGVACEFGAESDEDGRSHGDRHGNTWAALVCVEHLRYYTVCVRISTFRIFPSSVSPSLSEEVKKLASTLNHALQEITPTNYRDHTHWQLLMFWSQAVSALHSINLTLPTLSWDHLQPLIQ